MDYAIIVNGDCRGITLLTSPTIALGDLVVSQVLAKRQWNDSRTRKAGTLNGILAATSLCQYWGLNDQQVSIFRRMS